MKNTLELPLTFRLIILFVALAPPFVLQAQYENFVRYEDYTYVQNIRTVQLYPAVDDLKPAIIPLNEGMNLKLSFDDLDSDFKNYSYTFIHCDAYWRQSNIQKQEYLVGFTDNYIQNYRFSINTLTPFVHYSLEFPNRDVRFSKSGNYLLVVYQNDDPNDVVITRRFMLYEQIVAIGGDVKRATSAEYRDTHHEIDFFINHANYAIQDPFRDLKVVIQQNRRWDNAIYGIQPRFIRGNQLDYDYELENLFVAGNEFRYFDTKDLNLLLQRVAKIEYTDAWQVYVDNDNPRTFAKYSFYDDVNGLRVIRNQRGRDNDLEADYAWVHFRLRMPEPEENGNIYLFGQMSDWNIRPEFQMHYNYEQFAYEGKVFLKQGYYNYAYLLLKDGEYTGDISHVEGTRFETENDYAVYVYNMELGQRYDRLIGVMFINSRGGNNY